MVDDFVSVAVLTYNSADYIEETLDSIYNQTYKKLELVISDDGSSDDTVIKCNNWKDKYCDRFVDLKVLTVPNNTGIPANYNRAVRACGGSWIKLIDGDDTLTPNCILDMVSFVHNNQEALFVHAAVNEYIGTFNPENFRKILGTKSSAINLMPSASLQKEVLLRENTVYSASMFVKKSVFEDYGYFDEKYKGMEDFPFLLNLVDNGVYLFFLDKVVANYRRSPTSVQSNSNFGGIYMRSSVDYYFDKKYKYYKGIEKISLTLQNLLRRHLLIYINNNTDGLNTIRYRFLSFLVYGTTKFRTIISNKKLSELINKYGFSESNI